MQKDSWDKLFKTLIDQKILSSLFFTEQFWYKILLFDMHVASTYVNLSYEIQYAFL